MSFILFATLAGAPTSAYSALNLDNCEILTVAHAGEGDWSVRRCPGRGGVSLIVNEDDSRFDIDVGVDNGQFESPAVISDLGPQVEWRSEGGRPFAIIYRYNIPEASAGNRSELAVESVGRPGRPGCLVALITASPTGNARAREIADTRARTFRCGRDERLTE
jgi:hypothetical protein